MKKSDILNEICKIQDIVFHIEAGVCDKEILELFNIKASRLRAIKSDSDGLIESLQSRVDFIEEIESLYRNCLTLEEISELKGTSRQNISRIINLSDADRYDGGASKLKMQRKEKLKDLYNEGKCLEDICSELNLSEEVVRNYASELNIKLVSKKRIKSSEIKKRIKELRKLGKTQIEISNELNLSQSYVSKILLTEYKRTFLTPEEYAKRDSSIYESYLKGITVKDIAVHFNMNESNVRRVIYKMENKRKVGLKENV